MCQARQCALHHKCTLELSGGNKTVPTKNGNKEITPAPHFTLKTALDHLHRKGFAFLLLRLWCRSYLVSGLVRSVLISCTTIAPTAPLKYTCAASQRRSCSAHLARPRSWVAHDTLLDGRRCGMWSAYPSHVAKPLLACTRTGVSTSEPPEVRGLPSLR